MGPSGSSSSQGGPEKSQTKTGTREESTQYTCTAKPRDCRAARPGERLCALSVKAPGNCESHPNMNTVLLLWLMGHHVAIRSSTYKALQLTLGDHHQPRLRKWLQSLA